MKKFDEDDLNCAQTVFFEVFKKLDDGQQYSFDNDFLSHCLDMCLPFGKGAGTGFPCGAVIAALMCAGLFCGENSRTVALALLTELHGRYKCLDCPHLLNCVCCENFTVEIAEKTYKIIKNNAPD